MSEQSPAVLYLHGFNSSPDSRKAQQFKQFCASHTNAVALVPALPHHPGEALALLRSLVLQWRPLLLVGSSLGGFYATVLAEESGTRAVLINPAVAPCEHLGPEFLGPRTNPYTGESWEFTHEHAQALQAMTLPAIERPELYLLLVQTGDKVLDYRHASAYYHGCRQIVQEGGSHAFEDFNAMLPQICAFGGLSLS
jgi:predicted esterase YcpF (UPF0227 family)